VVSAAAASYDIRQRVQAGQQHLDDETSSSSAVCLSSLSLPLSLSQTAAVFPHVLRNLPPVSLTATAITTKVSQLLLCLRCRPYCYSECSILSVLLIPCTFPPKFVPVSPPSKQRDRLQILT